ncbi:MAG TPA: hypothetical protein QGF58_07220 [Myxococcota bacterium]|nr:hypothetical protein [Myxococcota bacterium]
MLWTLLACDSVFVGRQGGDDSLIVESGSPDSDDTVEPDCSGGAGGGVGYDFFEADGQSYWLYVPLASTECAPLLLFGHGGNQAGSVRDGFWMDPMGSMLPYEAEERGYVLMVPFLEDAEGPQEHGWSLELVPQMEAMIADAASRYDIDLARVTFAGTSAGGHMACYWGLYEPRGITSAVVMSAGIGGYFDYPDPEPDPKLPFVVVHDPDDEVVPYRYSEQLVEDLEEHGHEYVFHSIELGGNGHGWSPEATTLVLDSWLGE